MRKGRYVRKAVIDLGSNSFHLLVADVEGTDISPALRKRAMLHLGREITENGALPDNVLTDVVETTREFVAAAQSANANAVKIVATAAIRDATNRDTIVDAITQATGVPVNVLTGEAEGRYAFHGVSSRDITHTTPRTVLDLGGGSLEIVTGITAQDATVHSLPIGVSRMMRLASSDPVTPKERDSIAHAVKSHLADVNTNITDNVTLIGGSIRALARILDAAKQPYTTDAIGDLADLLISLSAKKRADVKGMRQRRVEHLHVAAVIWHTVLTTLAIPTFTVSSSGLREGVLLGPLAPSPQIRRLKPAYRRHVDSSHVGERVSIRHLATDAEHGTRPTDVVGRLAAFDDEMALVIDRHGALHILDTTMILASKVIPQHPTRAAEPAVGTKDAPVEREAARAVVMHRGGVLLVAHHPEPDRTVWTAPGGGIDVNETAEQAVVRELREELGVAVTVGEILFTRTAEFAFRGVWLRQHETWFAAELDASFTEADAPLQDASTSQVRSFTYEELTDGRTQIAPEDLAAQIAHLFTRESHPTGAP